MIFLPPKKIFEIFPIFIRWIRKLRSIFFFVEIAVKTRFVSECVDTFVFFSDRFQQQRPYDSEFASSQPAAAEGGEPPGVSRGYPLRVWL